MHVTAHDADQSTLCEQPTEASRSSVEQEEANMSKRSKLGFPAGVVDVTQPINESIVCAAIRQCLETADHYVRRGNRRDAEFFLDTADAYANRLIFCRQIDEIAAQRQVPRHLLETWNIKQ
jgi:hypothetical protein